MKGLFIALRLSAFEHLRGIRNWTETFFYPKGFPPGLAVAGIEYPPSAISWPTHEDKKAEGFLWGVPKHRKSVEKRVTKKFGSKEWTWKMLIPKYNLLVCDTCGHHYQAKHLCRNCYQKTIEESKVIRETFEAKLGHSADDKEVIVLYDSDKRQQENQIASLNLQNKIIVEIPKERPSFFSANLLQKSTAGINRKAKDVTTTQAPAIVHNKVNTDQ